MSFRTIGLLDSLLRGSTVGWAVAGLATAWLLVLIVLSLMFISKILTICCQRCYVLKCLKSQLGLPAKELHYRPTKQILSLSDIVAYSLLYSRPMKHIKTVS